MIQAQSKSLSSFSSFILLPVNPHSKHIRYSFSGYSETMYSGYPYVPRFESYTQAVIEFIAEPQVPQVTEDIIYIS